MCAPRVTQHTSIRYSSSCHTRVNMGASIFFTAAMIRAFGSARSRGNGETNTRSWTYPKRKKSQGMSGDLGGHSISGWSCDIPKHKTTSPPERPFSRYIQSHRLAAEMWITMKNSLLGKKFLSCSFYLYRFRKYVSYGFPIINVCNPGVHYETPCTMVMLS